MVLGWVFSKLFLFGLGCLMLSHKALKVGSFFFKGQMKWLQLI